MNITTHRSPEDALNKSEALPKNYFDNAKYNIDCPTNRYRNNAVVSVLVLIVLYPFAVGIYFLQQNIRQWTNINLNHDKHRYAELLRTEKTEKRYFVRVMIVGKKAVGKTCLVRRLLKESIDNVESTDGVDIVVNGCKINIEDGKWMISKELSDDRKERMQRALIQNKMQNKDMSNDYSENHTTVEMVDNDIGKGRIENNNDTKSMTNVADFETSTIIDKKNIADPTDGKHSSRLENEQEDNENPLEHFYEKNNVDMDDNVKDNEYIIKNSTSIRNENEDNISLPLEMPSDLMSHVFPKTPNSNVPSNHFALCGLWDFAGQKEFYATHQTFLTSTAIYLLVVDMDLDIWRKKKENTKETTETMTENSKEATETVKENTKETTETMQNITSSFADFQNDKEYLDFWFDSIHCYRTYDPPLDKRSNTPLDPPVIVVFTGMDKCEKVNRDAKKDELCKRLMQVIGEKGTNKYHHFRHMFCVSNKNDDDQPFEDIRKKIWELAAQMHNWGVSEPLKWILLEQLIEINKNKGMDYMKLENMQQLANHQEIGISKKSDVLLFLRFQREMGNIIFFEDIPNLIILNPQWLANSFRCLVSDRLDINKVNDKCKFEMIADFEILKTEGKISDALITTLFEIKSEKKFLEQKEDLLKVMEKFDILVAIEGTNSYLMPSMMPSSSFVTVCQNIGIIGENCQRSSCLCLKFEFLPPAFFNHLFVWLINKYKPSKATDNSESLALFRGICVFDFDRSGTNKLLVKMSVKTIAVQVVSFKIEDKEYTDLCFKVRKELLEEIESIQTRHNLKISYTEMFKCNDVNIDNTCNAKTFQELKETKEFHCFYHKSLHKSDMIYLPWTKNRDEGKGTECTIDAKAESLDSSDKSEDLNESSFNQSNQCETQNHTNPQAERLAMESDKLHAKKQNSAMRLPQDPNHLKDIRDLALRHNFRVINVAEDGNCLYHAASEQMGNLLNPLPVKERANELRSRLVNFLRQHPTTTQGESYSKWLTNNETWKNYLDRMNRPGEFGDEIIIRALCHCFALKVCVLSTLNHDQISTYEPQGIVGRGPHVVYLGHLHSILHYVILTPLKGEINMPLLVKNIKVSKEKYTELYGSEVELKVQIQEGGRHIFWLFNGDVLNTSNATKYRSVSASQPSLKIYNLHHADIGYYVCKVVYEPENENEEEDSVLSPTIEVELIEPAVHMNIHSIHVYIGNKVSIGCKIFNCPRDFKLFWEKIDIEDDEKIDLIDINDQTKEKYEMFNRENPNLTIKNAQLSDEAFYCCGIEYTSSSGDLIIIRSERTRLHVNEEKKAGVTYIEKQFHIDANDIGNIAMGVGELNMTTNKSKDLTDSNQRSITSGTPDSNADDKLSDTSSNASGSKPTTSDSSRGTDPKNGQTSGHIDINLKEKSQLKVVPPKGTLHQQQSSV